MILIELASKKINKVKKAIWANPNAYLKLDIIDNKLGPWGHLYDQPIQDNVGIDSPQNVLIIGDNENDWIPFNNKEE